MIMTNNGWRYEFTADARKDLESLDGHQRRIVIKALDKIVQNPLPRTLGGYGIPLGNKHGFDLKGCCEVKLRGQNLRVIYKLENRKMIMIKVAIDKRGDFEAYRSAYNRTRDK